MRNDFETNGEAVKLKLSVAEKSLFGIFLPHKAFKTVHAARYSGFFLPGNCWQNVFLLLFTFQGTKKDSRETQERRSKLPEHLAFSLTVSFKRGDAQHHWTLMQITWWEMALSCVAKLKWMLSQSWSQGGRMTSHWCCSDAPLKVLDGMYDAHESSVVKVLRRGKGCSPPQSDAWTLDVWCPRSHYSSRLSWPKESHCDRRPHWGRQA